MSKIEEKKINVYFLLQYTKKIMQPLERLFACPCIMYVLNYVYNLSVLGVYHRVNYRVNHTHIKQQTNIVELYLLTFQSGVR